MPQIMFIWIELSAAFWIQSKPPEIVPKTRRWIDGEEKDTYVVRLKNGVVKFQGF